MKKEKIVECLKALVNAWLILILGVLPLYMKNGFVMIGSEKYFFFRNVSLAIGLLMLPIFLLFLFRKDKAQTRKWTLTDICVLSFGICSFLSFLGSTDRVTAVWGTAGWYMGLLSQLLFVWFYFLISRFCDNQNRMLRIAACSAALVMLLGLLNRFDIDVLGNYQNISDLDWNRKHQISTIGNNNWYAGYISIMGGLFLAEAYAGKGWRRVLGMAGSFLYFATVLTQGTTTAILSAMVILTVLLFLAVGEREKSLHLLEILTLLPAANLFIRAVVRLHLAGLVMENETLCAMFFHPVWYGMAVVFPVSCIALRWWIRHSSREWHIPVKRCRWIMAAVLCACACTLACIGLSQGWDAGRIELWKLALKLFGKGGVWSALFGVGPDCFYQALSHWFPEKSVVTVSGIWQGAIRANAHNEWLTMLVNEGVLGLAAYTGIFAAGLCSLAHRIRKERWRLGIFLGLAGYLVCACFTFQQVMSTPFAFIFLGMAESGNEAE